MIGLVRDTAALGRAAARGAAVFCQGLAAFQVALAPGGGRLPKRPFWWINLVLVIQLALNTLGNLAATGDAEHYGMGGASIIGCLLCLAALSSQPRPDAG